MTRLVAALLLSAPAHAIDCAVITANGGVVEVPCASFVASHTRTAHSFLLEIEGITGDSALMDSRAHAPLAAVYDRPDGSSLVVIDGPAQAAGWTAAGAALATEASVIVAVELDGGIARLPEGEPLGRLQAVVFEPNDANTWLWLSVDAPAG
jgi:hypothetical protein